LSHAYLGPPVIWSGRTTDAIGQIAKVAPISLMVEMDRVPRAIQVCFSTIRRRAQ